MFLETILPLRVSFRFALPLAVLCFATGPLLILWAQYTSRHAAKVSAHPEQKKYFARGPYRFVRNPTQLGLLLLVGGYALVSHSLTFFVVVFLSYLLSNYYFYRYEQLAKKEFGSSYEAYQSAVRKVL